MDNVSIMTMMIVIIMPEGNYFSFFKVAPQMGACASAPAQETLPWWRFMVKWRFFWSKFLYSVKSVQKGLKECVLNSSLGCSAVPCWVKGVLAAYLDAKTLCTSVPSTGRCGWDCCLQTSTQHSCFLTCLHQYLLLITLALSSLLTSKGGRLPHCERIFSAQAHYLFWVIFQGP